MIRSFDRRFHEFIEELLVLIRGGGPRLGERG
jgi:hypothetical protein